MAISEEAFKSLVVAATQHRRKVVKVAVNGFNVVLTLKARRYTYDVSTFYDAAADHWAMNDIYNGNLIRQVVNEIAENMKRQS